MNDRKDSCATLQDGHCRPYMVWVGEFPQDGACLVFAMNASKAKNVAWNECAWIGDVSESFIDLRSRWMRNNPWIEKQTREEGPHCIDDPPTCIDCKRWGNELLEDGTCKDKNCCRINQEGYF